MQYAKMRAAALAATLALGGTLAHAAGDAAPKATTPERVTQAKKPAKKPLIVDINRAGKAELMKLTDIDEALAGRIIAARPYRTKAELVTRNVVPGGTYEAIKRNIVAKPK